MKQVVMIGDSIRMGYQGLVVRSLAGAAKVWGPEKNGGNSRNVVTHLDEWVILRNPDIVHLNCGLHDIKTEFDGSNRAVPLGEYEDNLRKIFERVEKESDATMIWATTTPVNHEWHRARKSFDRFEADVSAYNEAALRIAGELDLMVDDLYAVVQRIGRDEHLASDGVHFTREGYSHLARSVVNAIRKIM